MRSAAFAMLAGLVLVLGHSIELGADRQSSDVAISGILPDVPGCRRARWDAQWTPQFSSPDALFDATYHCGPMRVHVAIAQYLLQAPGKEAVSLAIDMLPDGLRDLQQDGGRRSLANGLTVRVGTAVAAESWMWYAVGTRAHSGKVSAKLDEAWRALTFQNVPKTAFFAVVESEDKGPRAQRLEQVVAQLWSWYAHQPGLQGHSKVDQGVPTVGVL